MGFRVAGLMSVVVEEVVEEEAGFTGLTGVSVARTEWGRKEDMMSRIKGTRREGNMVEQQARGVKKRYNRTHNGKVGRPGQRRENKTDCSS